MVVFDNSFIACMHVAKYVEMTRPRIFSLMKRRVHVVRSEVAAIQYSVWH